jgi:homoserine dehydrogenase
MERSNNFMQRNKIKLGIFGFGCVGQGLFNVLDKTKGMKAEIVKICVKDRNKHRTIPMDFFTYDKDEILDNPEVNVVVELIDDPEAAYEIVTKALRSGKNVVTANKKMVAEHFEELFNLQKEYNTALLYEASCCASIPIIRNLEEYYDNDLLNSVEGIFNGSTNYIMTKVFNENVDFGTALEIARQNGFLESDPTLDIEGYDAKYKLCILLAHTFGYFVKPENIYNLGISRINDFDINYAREKGFNIKLVAYCRKVENNIYAFVLPKFVEKSSPLYNVNYEFNGIKVESFFSENQFFYGKGAGSLPTGSAVLSDISALTYDYKYEYKKYYQNHSSELSNDFVLDLFLRYPNRYKMNLSIFKFIRESFSSQDYNYINGQIKFSSLIESRIFQNKDISIIRNIGEPQFN